MGHIELLRIILGAQRQNPGDRHTWQQHRSALVVRVGEIPLHHLHRKPVDPGRHRGVRGEHRAGPHHGQRCVEIQAGIDQFADPLGAEEAGVTFVHVIDLRRRQPVNRGERADRPDAADACEDLLLHAMLLVAAIEAICHPAHVVLVLRDVGIQQQQRNATDLRDPDPRPQPGGVRQRQLHQRRRARVVGEQP